MMLLDDNSALFKISAGLVMQLFLDIQGCSINTLSHVEGWHSILKVSHDYETFQSNAIDNLTSYNYSCAQECRLVIPRHSWAILP